MIVTGTNKEMHMDNQKFGEIIAKARKNKGMTQKDLAEILRVTDKAVSKWERGKGYPEITLLPSLSKALDIPAQDLLFEDIEKDDEAPAVSNEVSDKIITGVIQYSGEISRQKRSKIVFPIISASLALLAFLCLLVNYCIDQTFTWSIYPLASLLLCFVVLAPIFLLQKHRTLAAHGVLLITLIPYLFVIEHMAAAGSWVIPLALPIAALTIGCSAMCIWILLYTRINRYIAMAAAFFLPGVVANLAINEIVVRYVGERTTNISVMITALSFTAVAIVLLIVGFARRKGRV
jgi:transcriptional regulator with XRE-family HTH domain